MDPWLKAIHIIGLILWMGGLFLLARHLGDHVDLDTSEAREAFASWERKTYYMSVLPGFILSLGSGLYALFAQGFGHYLSSEGPWGGTFHFKLLLIVILIGADQAVHFKMRSLHGDGDGSRGLFMAVHGIVGLLFIVIVFLMKTRVLA